MSSTSGQTHTTGAARIIPFPKGDALAPAPVARSVAHLQRRIRAGDGAAMLDGLRQARGWIDAFNRFHGAEEAQPLHLIDAANAMQDAVAVAPSASLSGALAKAELAAWHHADDRSGDAPWEAELATSLRDTLAALASAEVAQ